MTSLRSPGAALGLALVLVLTVFGCTQATSDPDAAVKALITSQTWDTDTANYPSDDALTIRFFSDGSASYAGATRSGAWSYSGGVFTITTTLGTFTTAAADLVITSSQFTFTYYLGLCHLIPKDSTLG